MLYNLIKITSWLVQLLNKNRPFDFIKWSNSYDFKLLFSFFDVLYKNSSVWCLQFSISFFWLRCLRFFRKKIFKLMSSIFNLLLLTSMSLFLQKKIFKLMSSIFNLLLLTSMSSFLQKKDLQIDVFALSTNNCCLFSCKTLIVCRCFHPWLDLLQRHRCWDFD